MNGILTIEDKSRRKILRSKTADFDFRKYGKKEIYNLVKMMRETMIEADGVGLAANQIGLDISVFVARLPESEENKDRKFYAVFNPKITRFSGEKTVMDEGCLSVPGGYYGEVLRPEKITLEGYDKNGKKLKIKAFGLLARVFQHEVDHLNGKLFIDKTKNLKKLKEIEQGPKI